MITVNGQSHPTIAEAATYFGVSTRTVRDWIVEEKIPPPPQIEWGMRTVDIFPNDYLEKADAARRRRKHR